MLRMGMIIRSDTLSANLVEIRPAFVALSQHWVTDGTLTKSKASNMERARG